MSYIKYNECVVQVNDQKVFAVEASISNVSNIATSRIYGGGFREYSASNQIDATMNIQYYTTGKNDFIAELTGNNSCSGSFGGIEFSGAYLNNYQINMEPYKPVTHTASFTMYSGFNGLVKTGSFEEDPGDLANSAYTELINFNKNSIGIDFPKSINYSINCTRVPSYIIGSEFPRYVTLTSISKKMRIEGENIGDLIKFTGKKSAYLSISPRNIDYEARGKELSCLGMIKNQNLGMAKNSVLNGDIEVEEEFL